MSSEELHRLADKGHQVSRQEKKRADAARAALDTARSQAITDKERLAAWRVSPAARRAVRLTTMMWVLAVAAPAAVIATASRYAPRHYAHGAPSAWTEVTTALDPSVPGRPLLIPLFILLGVTGLVLVLVPLLRISARAGAARYLEAERAWAAAQPFKVSGYPDCLGNDWDEWQVEVTFRGRRPTPEFLTDVAHGLHPRYEVDLREDEVRLTITLQGSEAGRGLAYRDLFHDTVTKALVAMHDEYSVAWVAVTME